MIDDQPLRQKAQKTLALFAGRLQQVPGAMPQMLVAAGATLGVRHQIIIAGQPDADDTRALLREVRRRYLPHRVLLLLDAGPGQHFLSECNPFFKSLSRLDGRATAYVCENFACQLPTTDPAMLDRLLTGRVV